jgi:hypothetical protein
VKPVFALFIDNMIKKTHPPAGGKNKKASKKAKRAYKPKKGNSLPFSFGNINPDRGRILVLVIMIIFTVTGMAFANVINSLKADKSFDVPAEQRKNVALEKEMNKLVEGYPIASMTSYISQKDPKVAAFMIAIAKKESAWGKHRPVLAGRDCYNYWGFRLSSEKMGSGGHTCFDSPEEAVDVVASRIDEMVNDEKMDSPKDMIVWKCGYGCQDQAKTASEQKWISDVNIYYDKLSGYL